jgi:hypothetical protein
MRSLARTLVVLGGLCSAVAPRVAQTADRLAIPQAASHGIAWLKSHQGADGGWHSQTYGTLRPGVGTTALVVRTLSEDRSANTTAAYEQGIAFLTKRREDAGFVVAPDGTSENAVYATALTVIALSQRPMDGSEDHLKAMQQALIAAQHRPAESMENPDAGGWASLPTARDHVNMEIPCNISATAAVVRALTARGSVPADLRDSAQAFLRRCQNRGTSTHDDGGFFFTPHIDHPLNKYPATATPNRRLHPVSYFPATCDGLAALARLNGQAPPSVDSRSIHRLTTLPGPSLRTPESLSEKSPPVAIDGLFFYSAAAFADVWQAFPSEHDKLEQLRQHFLKAIVDRQHPDGSWTNPVTTMREDDPLISTSFALLALKKLGG